MALQAPVDGRARGDRLAAQTRELMFDPPWSPPRMLAAHLADQRLGLARDLVRAGGGPVGVVGQGGEAAGLVAGDPRVDALAGHAEVPGYLDHLPTVLHHREHGLIPLFHDTQLHQHGPTSSGDEEVSSISRSHRQGSAGTGVKDQPERCQTSGDAGMTSITRNTTLLGGR